MSDSMLRSSSKCWNIAFVDIGVCVMLQTRSIIGVALSSFMVSFLHWQNVIG